MLDLFRHSNDQGANLYFESVEHQFGSQSAKSRLPKHISSLESYGRRKTTNSGQHQIPTRCPLRQNTSYPTPATNLAVNILRYQLQDHVSQQRHRENLRGNLQHRLAVAQAKKNSQLVSILQEEFRQLEGSLATVDFKQNV